MANLLQDIRYGIRVLLKSPGFTVFAVVVLTLGIAANTAVFSIADAILMRPLPYHDASRLVMVWEDATSYGFPRDTPAPGNFAEWKARNQVFEDMAAMSSDESYNLTGEGNPEELLGRNVTANLLSVLGVAPALGRDFRSEDDVPGAPRVAILSYGLSVRRFGAQEGAVGKEIWLDGEKFTIIGVMPRGFQFPDRKSELWTPIRFTKEQLANHGSHLLEVVARLKPGVSLATANANLATIAKQLEKEFPEDNQKLGALAVPLREELAGNMRAAILVLLGAVCFVLLIACANVANLLLSRASGRRRELAMRLTLGATRARIARQMLTESVLLATLAGIAGVLLATFGTPVLARLIPAGFAPLNGTGVDAGVLAFAIALSVLTGILFGIVPALRVSQIDLVTSLKQGGGQSGVGSGGRGLRDALVVAEVALAIVLLAGAALMIRSFDALHRSDAGFRPDHVLVMRTALPLPKYAEASRRRFFYDDVLARVGALPGVVSAGYTTWIPLTNTGGASMIRLEGHPLPPPGHEFIPNVRFISGGYLRSIGARLIEGRTFDGRDGMDTQPVALINQTMARDYWTAENPIGRRFHKGNDPHYPWITVIGVVADVHQVALDQPARPEMYMLYQQQKSFEEGVFNPQYLAVRTAGDPMVLAEVIRQQVWAVDKEQPVANVMPLQNLVDEKLAPRETQTSLLGGFALLALLLASLGIYAVLSFAVTQRTQEIGVRAALGARPADILRMVLAQGMKLFVIGAVIGLIAAFALSKTLAYLLYGVSASDPFSFAAVVLLLGAVTALACYIPARRAMRVDPMVAVRYE
jgi:predicted permease